jgi:hypothetical protein
MRRENRGVKYLYGDFSRRKYLFKSNLNIILFNVILHFIKVKNVLFFCQKKKIHLFFVTYKILKIPHFASPPQKLERIMISRFRKYIFTFVRYISTFGVNDIRFEFARRINI